MTNNRYELDMPGLLETQRMEDEAMHLRVFLDEEERLARSGVEEPNVIGDEELTLTAFASVKEDQDGGEQHDDDDDDERTKQQFLFDDDDDDDDDGFLTEETVRFLTLPPELQEPQAQARTTVLHLHLRGGGSPNCSTGAGAGRPYTSGSGGLGTSDQATYIGSRTRHIRYEDDGPSLPPCDEEEKRGGKGGRRNKGILFSRPDVDGRDEVGAGEDAERGEDGRKKGEVTEEEKKQKGRRVVVFNRRDWSVKWRVRDVEDHNDGGGGGSSTMTKDLPLRNQPADKIEGKTTRTSVFHLRGGGGGDEERGGGDGETDRFDGVGFSGGIKGGAKEVKKGGRGRRRGREKEIKRTRERDRDRKCKWGSRGGWGTKSSGIYSVGLECEVGDSDVAD